MVLLPVGTCADDWPMWRFDAMRSAAAPANQLPDDFGTLWTRDFGKRVQAWDDPLNLDLMTYDRVLEPIVVDGRIILSFNDRDKVAAFDADTGEEIWVAFADAPVRFPPVAWNGRVYFCSDDGFLYCVDAATGKQQWRLSGAPNSQKAIGNTRMISAWPARGGPVVRDGTVYFAAGIWPFMGTFIYAIDAESGEVEWVNDSTGAQYIKQPHSAPSFAGVAPQGAMVATEKTLLVPGGRSVPAAFERSSGQLRYFEINAGGKGTGGSFVCADEKHFYVHTRLKGSRAFHLHNGVKTAFMPNEPVLHDGRIYSAQMDGEKPVICAYGADHKQKWKLAADGTGDLILAGRHLVAAGSESVTLIEAGEDSGRVVRTIATGRKFERLICANQKLIGVTADGQLTVFGEGSSIPVRPADVATRPDARLPLKETVQSVLSAGDAEGYAMWFGSCDSDILRALCFECPFQELVVVDPSRESVERTRRELDARNVYGKITIQQGDLNSLRPPKYFANMVFVDGTANRAVTAGAGDTNGRTALSDLSDFSDLRRIYESVRPYGGVLYLLTAADDRPRLKEDVAALQLEQAQIEDGSHGVIIRKVGRLPGSADWTHQYGDVANTIKSDDRRVKLPLGILWFGGSSNMDVLPRHGHGPPEQVVGGRLYIQGINSLSCRDVYTGRVIWKRSFENLGTFDVYYDATYENTPLNPKYNQVHIPGANGRGTNYVATEDRVYILEGHVCHVLDPSSGETLRDIEIPGAGKGKEWGYIGVYRDVLLGGAGFANYQQRDGITLDSDSELKKSRAGFGTKSFNRAASLALAAFDRYSGELLWTAEANHSFWHNGIVAGGDRVYCLDRNPPQLEQAMRRRGLANPDTYRIAAFNYRTGRKAWEINDDVFGTWLSYSKDHDLLLQAGASGSDRLSGEVSQGMAVYAAATGAVTWKNASLKYTGPCILHNDLILTNTNSNAESAGAFYLKTGKQRLVPNPLTGDLQPWKLTRAYGCNNIIASENLLTFRSGAAGYYDLRTDGGTGNLGGFKSGCTSNLVVAGGVLNAPDYTRTCSCAYQNQTSLALVHMPDVEMWSVSLAASVESDNNRIRHLGLNFGAPGDRRDARGTLWLEYPATAGPSPPVSVRFNADAEFFCRHSSTLPDTDMSWVLASGARNVTDITIGLNLLTANLKSGIPISHADDDAEENENGSVNLDSSDLELVDDDGTQTVGLRFTSIPLARGARIRKAWIQMTCDEASDDATSLIIAAEDTGNAERFTDDQHDLTSRTRTSKEIGWQPKPWPQSGKAESIHRTPDLSELIETVVARKDWQPGNALAFLINGTGKRVAAARQNSSRSAPRLVVETDDTAVIASKSPPQNYRLKLYFGCPGRAQQNQTFRVVLPDSNQQQDVRLADDNATAVVEFEQIAVADELHIQLMPSTAQPVISGVELIRSEAQTDGP